MSRESQIWLIFSKSLEFPSIRSFLGCLASFECLAFLQKLFPRAQSLSEYEKTETEWGDMNKDASLQVWCLHFPKSWSKVPTVKLTLCKITCKFQVSGVQTRSLKMPVPPRKGAKLISQTMHLSIWFRTWGFHIREKCPIPKYNLWTLWQHWVRNNLVLAVGAWWEKHQSPFPFTG